MFGSQKKPYTAITVQIERLTGEAYDENDVGGIVDLVEVVRLQQTGPTEAARAIRKKLKYGSVHRQLRALTILDGLIENAGPRFQRAFADEPLLERLRVAATDPMSDPDVRAKCKILFGQWSVAYKATPGMERIASLYKQLPQRKKPQVQQQSKVLRETEAEAELEEGRQRATSVSSPQPMSPTTSSNPVTLSSAPHLGGGSKTKNKKDKSKAKPFNLEKEKPQLLQTIASSSVASTNLMNALKLINRESKRVSEDPEVMKRFETCKMLRRQILRYIQHVESEQWLGGLIHANEELVTALMTFEVLDKSVDQDSDSEDEEYDQAQARRGSNGAGPGPRSPKGKEPLDSFAGLSIERKVSPPKPPRPALSYSQSQAQAQAQAQARQQNYESDEDSVPEEVEEADEDDDDPFADRNAVNTPHVEKSDLRWKEV